MARKDTSTADVQAAIKRRSDWINRNPELAADYLKLGARDRAEVDALFLAKRGREVSGTVQLMRQTELVGGRASRAVKRAKKLRETDPDARLAKGRLVSGLDSAAIESQFWILYTQGMA
jgi:hypothetical protein